MACCLSAHLGTSGAALRLVLEDNFDKLNFSLWKHEITLGGGGNFEFQYYQNNRTNSYVKDGILHIVPTLLADEIGEENVKGSPNWYNLDVWGGSPADECTSNAFYGCFRTAGNPNYVNPIKSARIRTAESFSFTYGKVEVSARLPIGDWLWPAIWMLPTDQEYGTWPASGEVDIMESRGNSPSYPSGGYDSFGSTLHWGPSVSENSWPKTHATVSGLNLTDDFHIYGLIWNETYIGTYFDSESNPVFSFPINQSFWELGGWESPPWDNPWEGMGDNAPFNRRFHLIINLACGGVTTYFPDGHGKPWQNDANNAVDQFYDAKDDWYPTWTQDFAIDSVRVWTYEESGGAPQSDAGRAECMLPHLAVWAVTLAFVFVLHL